MGVLKSAFWVFTSNYVVVVFGLLSAGHFFIVGWWGSNTCRDLVWVPFSVVGWCGSNS